MTEHVRVVVISGGGVGCSALYHLAANAEDPINCHLTGSVRLAHTRNHMDDFRYLQSMARANGLDCEILSPTALKARCPFLPALHGVPRSAQTGGNGLQHQLCERGGHYQACGVQLDLTLASGAEFEDAAHDCRRRRQRGAPPFVSQSNCFVVPPMKFALDACK